MPGLVQVLGEKSVALFPELFHKTLSDLRVYKKSLELYKSRQLRRKSVSGQNNLEITLFMQELINLQEILKLNKKITRKEDLISLTKTKKLLEIAKTKIIINKLNNFLNLNNNLKLTKLNFIFILLNQFKILINNIIFKEKRTLTLNKFTKKIIKNKFNSNFNSNSIKILNIFNNKKFESLTFKNYLKIISNIGLLIEYYLYNLNETLKNGNNLINFLNKNKLKLLNKNLIFNQIPSNLFNYNYKPNKKLYFSKYKINIKNILNFFKFNNFKKSNLLNTIYNDKSWTFVNNLVIKIENITKLILINNNLDLKNKPELYKYLSKLNNDLINEYQQLITINFKLNIKNILFFWIKANKLSLINLNWKKTFTKNSNNIKNSIIKFYKISNIKNLQLWKLISSPTMIQEFYSNSKKNMKHFNNYLNLFNRTINLKYPRFIYNGNNNDISKNNIIYNYFTNDFKIIIPIYYSKFLKSFGLIIKLSLYKTIINKWKFDIKNLNEKITKIKLWFIQIEKEKNKYNPYRKLYYGLDLIIFSKKELNLKLLQRIRDIYLYGLYNYIFNNKNNKINKYSFTKNKNNIFFNAKNNYHYLFNFIIKLLVQPNSNFNFLNNKKEFINNFDFFQNNLNKNNLFIKIFNLVNNYYNYSIYHIFIEFKNKIYNNNNNLIKGSNYMKLSNLVKINNYFKKFLSQLNNNFILKPFFIVGPKFMVAKKKEILYDNSFTKNQKLIYNLIYTDLKYHDQWNDLYKLKRQWIFNYTLKGNIIIYDSNNTLNMFSYIDNYQLIKWFLIKFSIFKIVNQVYTYNYFSNNRNTYNLPIKFVIQTLNNFFNHLSCLISRPIFYIYNDKIIIDLFFFINKLSIFYILFKTKNLIKIDTSFLKILPKKFKYLNSINKKDTKNFFKLIARIRPLRIISSAITDSWKFIYTINKLIIFLGIILNKPIQINLTRMFYPYKNANILAKFIGLNSKKFDFSRMIFRIILNSEVINPLNMKFFHTFANPLWYSQEDNISSFIGGINIKKAGRLITQKIIPRITVYNKFLGTFSRNKIIYYDFARFTSLHKRGIVCFTVNISHFIVD